MGSFQSKPEAPAEANDAYGVAGLTVDPLGSQPMTLVSTSSLLERENFTTQDMVSELARDRFAIANETSWPAPMDNSAFAGYTFTPLELPRDADGYVVAFDPLNDAQAAREFFLRYGVVVFRDVVDADACDRSVDELWDFLKRHSPDMTIDRDQPRTWCNAYWPPLGRMGICGNTCACSKQLCENRQNPRTHAAFAALFGTERLWVNCGRLGCMRPTRGIPLPASLIHPSVKPMEASESASMSHAHDAGLLGPADANGNVRVDLADWCTISEWLHFDYNPFTGGLCLLPARFARLCVCVCVCLCLC